MSCRTLLGSFVLTTLVVAGVSSTAVAGQRERRQTSGFTVPGKNPNRKYVAATTLSHDGLRLESRGVTTSEVYGSRLGMRVRYPDLVSSWSRTQRTVSRADERQLRRRAREQLRQERRGKALVAAGRVEEGTALIRASQAPLFAPKWQVAGVSTTEPKFGFEHHFDAFGHHDSAGLTGQVTFARVEGSTALRPVRLAVTGGAQLIDLDLAAAKPARYSGR